MTGTEKIKMTINIGGERVKLEVPFDSQNDVRDAEKKADNLYKELRIKYPSRSDANLLAMVAFTLSSDCLELFKINSEAMSLAKNCEKSISDISQVNPL